MSLSEVEHQGHAQSLIQRAFAADRVPHAYLFHGPDGVGKEKLAVGLAQLLLCPTPVDEPVDAQRVGVERLRMGCGSCGECRLAVAGTHPDLHLIYRQLSRDHPDAVVRKRKALTIGVDVLRHFVIDKTGLTPIHGRAKMFIIREADRITPQAQNALLKTLEEPPGATVLILLVGALDRMLPTTQSRCQVVRFDALPTSFVAERLATLVPSADAEAVAWYARCAEGSLGRGVEFARDDLYAMNARLVPGFVFLCGGDTGLRNDKVVKSWTDESKALGDCFRKRDAEITNTEAGRCGLKAIFQAAARWYGDVLRVSAGEAAQTVNQTFVDQIRRIAKPAAGAGFEPSKAIEAVNRLAQAEWQLDRNVYVPLCLGALVDDLARMGRRALAAT